MTEDERNWKLIADIMEPLIEEDSPNKITLEGGNES